jgi:hypothetical protein
MTLNAECRYAKYEQLLGYLLLAFLLPKQTFSEAYVSISRCSIAHHWENAK